MMNELIKYAITNDEIKYAIKNDIIKYAIINDVIKYAITNDGINKKIYNNFVFPNTPAQLTLDDTCLFDLRRHSIRKGCDREVGVVVENKGMVKIAVNYIVASRPPEQQPTATLTLVPGKK